MNTFRSRLLAMLAGVLLLSGSFAPLALAASSWNPTLLVNTESFETIDEGDSTTNIQMKFGQTLNESITYDRTNNWFKFSRGINVGGNIVGTGSLSIKRGMSGASLRVDGNADVWGSLSATGSLKTKSGSVINGDNDTNDAPLVFGNATGPQSLKFVNGSQRFEFTKGVQAGGDISGSGSLHMQNDVYANGNATVNADRGATDAVLTFGNATANKALTFSNANQRFEFNSTVKTTGTLSGNLLNIDGATTLRGTTYNWPTAQGASNTFLRNDGAGGLSWTAASVGSGSGQMLSIHPEYPNAVYTASGSQAVGQLTYSGALGIDNLYRWTTSKGTLQDYWVAVRVQVPKNFTHFTSSGGLVLRVRTKTTSAADNHITFRMLDTNNAAVAVDTNAQLVSSTANAWRDIRIGNVTSGTYAGEGYIKLLIKLAATVNGAADLGKVDIRWSNTTP